MRQTGKITGKVLALVFSALVLLVPAVTAAAGTGFSDVKGHWAEQPITEMSAYDIVHGYPGGEFAPDNTVTFIEAVVMILNTLGLGDEAGKTDISGLSYNPKVYWGKEYLALAVQKGMLTKEGLPYLDPERKACRYETASLLCLALNLSPETDLSFTDAASIPEKYRGHVGAVAKKGIMRGLPGNLFAPQMNVTRAQMCAMLQRIIEDGWVNAPPPMTRLTGRANGVAGLMLTVSNLTGERAVAVPADYRVNRGNQAVELNSLVEGERVRLIVDSRGHVLYACAPGEYGEPGATTSGIVYSLAQGEKGMLRLTLQNDSGNLSFYDVFPDARLIRDGKNVGYTDLAPDAYVKVGMDGNNRVFQIELHELNQISGTITRVGTNSLTLRARGVKSDYRVTGNTKVTRNIIREIPYSDLKSGDRADLWVAGDTVLQINVLSGTVTSYSGMVLNNYTKEISIHINGTEKRYDLDEKAEIVKDGRVMDLEELKRGDYIIFELNNEQTITYIEVIDEEEGEFEGTITMLTDSPRSISFDIGGLELDYDVTGDAHFFRNGDEINLIEIIPGAKVRVTVEEHRVTEIEVLDDQNITFSGRVSSVNEDTRRVALEVNGYLHNYSLLNGVVAKDILGKEVALAETKGYMVEVRLENGVITSLTVK
ncbi:MAG: S-layer homology domain-containing protein [Bacillota bacterium]